MRAETDVINVSKYENVTERAIRAIENRSVPRPDGCILWSGTVSRGGYGMSSYRGPGSKKYMIYVHRAMYVAKIGRIPEGYEVDHACHDPQVCRSDDVTGCTHRRCVNVSHLRLLSPRINTLISGAPSGVNARKTHCKRGHPLPEPRNGARTCQPCNTAAKRTETARRRGEIRARRLARAAELREARKTDEDRRIEAVIGSALPLLTSGSARNLRIRAGLTQAQLGALVGAPQSYVQCWETGRRTPTRALGARYADLIVRLSQQAA